MNKILILIILLLTTACLPLDEYSYSSRRTSPPTNYKWNAYELKWENTCPESKLQWNVYEKVWEYRH